MSLWRAPGILVVEFRNGKTVPPIGPACCGAGPHWRERTTRDEGVSFSSLIGDGGGVRNGKTDPFVGPTRYGVLLENYVLFLSIFLEFMILQWKFHIKPVIFPLISFLSHNLTIFKPVSPVYVFRSRNSRSHFIRSEHEYWVDRSRWELILLGNFLVDSNKNRVRYG